MLLVLLPERGYGWQKFEGYCRFVLVLREIVDAIAAYGGRRRCGIWF